MSDALIPNPVGHSIEDFQVLGQEHDTDHRWVGADMEVYVPPIGRFFLNIVTKERYTTEQLATVLSDADHPERLLREQSGLEQKQPFVLNDREITDDILQRKFGARVVEQDLADSLWFVGD